MNPAGRPGEQTVRLRGVVEMFEPVRCCELLLRRVAPWMKCAFTLFAHIFRHRAHAHRCDVRDESDWMSRYFFMGGLVSSNDPRLYSQRDARAAGAACDRLGALTSGGAGLMSSAAARQTAATMAREAWLKNTDGTRVALMPIHIAGTARIGRPAGRTGTCSSIAAPRYGAPLRDLHDERDRRVSHYLFDKR